MQHPDEGTIHAWIDGELPADDAAALEAHLGECAECSALAAEARGLVAASSRIVSALDIIPGDVIPKTAPRRRPWYASTQLRAAAAVVIVAGASLLVVKNGEVKKMERAVDTRSTASAPATGAAEPEQDEAAVMNAPSSDVAQAPPKATAKQLSKKESEAKSEGDLRDESARDAEVAAVAQAPAPSPVANSALFGKVAGARTAASDSLQRRRFGSTTSLDQVVVTGVAASSAPMELKKVRSDSAGNVTVYEVLPGAEVTLTDNGRQANAVLRASAQAKEKQLAMPAPPPAAVSAPKVVLNSISWTDKRGHLMVLTGPFSKEILESLRQRLPADQR
jgi:putative zinc finger protein